MTEEIIIDKEEFWDVFEQHPINAVEGLFSKIEMIVNLLKRLEQENKELKAYKDVNEDFKKAWDELNRKYTEVLNLAKQNADSNEYCLQELEKKNFALTQESQQKSQTICELYQENEVLTRENENRNDWITSLRKQCGKLVEEKLIYRSALEEIREELCYGRTFYEGYFDSENLSRTDKAIKKINECLGG